MPATDVPTTMTPDDADVIRDVAEIARQLEQLLAAAVPLLSELQAALTRISEKGA